MIEVPREGVRENAEGGLGARPESGSDDVNGSNSLMPMGSNSYGLASTEATVNPYLEAQA